MDGMEKDLNKLFIGDFCKTCKYEDTAVNKEPCCDCVSRTGAISGSTKPTKWIQGVLAKNLIKRSLEEE